MSASKYSLPEGYVPALVTYADTFPAGKQQIQDEFKRLFDQMQAGKGKEVVNATLSGKSFGFQVTMTVEEKFGAYGQALREILGTSATTTRATFPSIDR